MPSLRLCLALLVMAGLSACSDDPVTSAPSGGGFDLGTRVDASGSDGGAPDVPVVLDVATPDVEPDLAGDMGPDIAEPPPLVEDCVNGVDDTGDGLVDCADPGCSSAPPCVAEVCDSGADDDLDGRTDCADLECATTAGCLVEICNNGKSDDADADVDCADSDCAGAPNCLMTAEACDNGLDDDGDGTADCRDADCATAGECVNASNAATCGADGQQCNPAQGIEQNGFYCASLPGTPGAGVCYAICQPSDVTSCPLGTLCVDAVPADSDPRGVCFATECTQPFAQAECALGQQCEPLVNGYAYCRDLGLAAEGASCADALACSSGLVCAGGECKRSCDLAAPMCASGTCLGVFGAAGYGLCDDGCTPLSSGTCGAGEACAPTFQGYWACRPGGSAMVGDACSDTDACGEGLWCAEGICEALCTPWATGRCGASDICVDFGTGIGICAETCTSLAPDDCPDPGTRCGPANGDALACYRHGGAALGDACGEPTTCGKTLYCADSGECEQLCDPYEAASDFCPATQGCWPYDSGGGVCLDLTNGSAQGQTCAVEGRSCGDALVCGPGFGGSTCYQICRTALSDSTGANNADCASPTDRCDTTFGYADLGFCV